MPTVIDIIEAKRDGHELEAADIASIVQGYSDGIIPDYQMSSFLMAVVCRGMTTNETAALTRAMLESGDRLDLSSLSRITLDKHSTGGVGDKVSLAFVPIVASAGVPIAKMSGRGLGFTGGTLDKLESITGFRVALDLPEVLKQTQLIGACICAQTNRIVPADKKMYALRDVTGTVESVPLIAASIMSKKLAGGSDIILLDVKVGRGAFMKTFEDAMTLAHSMVDIGAKFGKKVVCELTAMDVPLGQAVGNLLEIQEIVELLQNGKCDPTLKELVIHLSDMGLGLANASESAESLIKTGAAYRKFCEMIEAQGGSISSINRTKEQTAAATVLAKRSGYISDIDAEAIGRSTMRLGAGRLRKEDTIDSLAGVWLDAPVGTEVTEGSPIAKIYGSAAKLSQELLLDIEGAFKYSDHLPSKRPLVLATVTEAGLI